MRTKYLLAASAAVLVAAVASAAPGMGGRGFAKLDTNNDGSITRAEIDAQAAERFAKIDADRDGFVTQAEMTAHRDAMRTQWAAKMKERADQGGERAAKRMERMEKRGERRAERGGDPFARRDANGDGRISLAEFHAGGGKMIERFDADKNGVVTQEEMAKAREAWKAKRKG
jgi:hypothetical protein